MTISPFLAFSVINSTILSKDLHINGLTAVFYYFPSANIFEFILSSFSSLAANIGQANFVGIAESLCQNHLKAVLSGCIDEAGKRTKSFCRQKNSLAPLSMAFISVG